MEKGSALELGPALEWFEPVVGKGKREVFVSLTVRSDVELERQALSVHAQAKVEADAQDLGVITICFTGDGAFRVNARDLNATLVVGLLHRAGLAVDRAVERLPSVTISSPEEAAKVDRPG